MIYKFDKIAYNSTVKKKPTDADRSNYIGLENIDPDSLFVENYGSDITPKGEKLIMKKGDVLFGKRRAYQKKVAIAPCDGIFSAHGMVLRPKEDVIDKDFFPFFIHSDQFLNEAVRISVGGLSPTINWRDLKELEFSLPPLSIQRELSKKLWAAYRLKESYKKLLLATRDMVKSQFIEMFKDKGYPLEMIKSFADVSTGSTPSKAHPEYWNGDKPWVSAEDMKSKYVYDTCEKVTNAGYATCKIIPVDTLMYVCRGSIGVMAINKIECATNQSICRATCHNNVCNVEFLYHALMYQRDNIKKKGTGTSFKSLNQTTFSELEIELPPYEEQMKFVAIAEQADKSEFELKKSIEAIDAVIKSLINN